MVTSLYKIGNNECWAKGFNLQLKYSIIQLTGIDKTTFKALGISAADMPLQIRSISI